MSALQQHVFVLSREHHEGRFVHWRQLAGAVTEELLARAALRRFRANLKKSKGKVKRKLSIWLGILSPEVEHMVRYIKSSNR